MRAVIATVCVLVAIVVAWVAFYVAAPTNVTAYNDTVRGSASAPRSDHMDELERRISALESAGSAAAAMRSNASSAVLYERWWI